jgi:glycosyltransferase involved in cell wall biosynthesis
MNSIPISVVMATYNGVYFLQEQIESILQQTIQPNEIIICDDGSTDGTKEILKSYATKGLIQFYENDTTLGVVDNFKKGVLLAKAANYIAFSDQDDIWMPHKLETLQKALSQLEQEEQSENLPCIVYSDLILMDERRNILNKSFWNELYHDVHEHCLHTLLFGNFVTGCSVMMNAASRSYFVNTPKAILHDVWLAFVGNAIGKIKAISTPLMYYRQHAQNQNYQLGNSKKTKSSLRWLRFKMLLFKNDYLQNEYFIAKTFLNIYAHEIEAPRKKVINYFLATKNMPHFIKEVMLKVYFFGRWKQSSK